MRSLTVGIEDDASFFDRALATGRAIDAGSGYQGEFRSFSSLAQLFGLFTPKRWELLEKLQALGPSSLRGLARELGRDVKRVHEDAARLLEEGIIERDADKKLFVPFERIHIAVDLDKAKSAA